MKRRPPVLAASLLLIAAAAAGPAAAQSPGAERSPGTGAQGPGAADQPHPAHIHVGVCPEPGDVAFPLNDLVTPGDEMVGVSSAIPVEVSSTVVEAALTDIVGGEHAINVHESADALGTYIACGDIGGPMLGTSDLAIGLAEQNGSGQHGVAWLHDNGDGTTRVDVILLVGGTPGTPGASEAPGTSMAPGTMAPGATAEPRGTSEPGDTSEPGATAEPVGSTAP